MAIPFILASTKHGTLIVNKNDRKTTSGGFSFGVGYQLLEHGEYDKEELDLTKQILDFCRHLNGDQVVAIDGGANIGVHSIEWAKHMTDWGCVIAIEAQEMLYYALAGNIAINNCFNVKAMHTALGDINKLIDVPSVDYNTNTSFGSVELLRVTGEDIGPGVDYSNTSSMPQRTIDSYQLDRVDFIKLDIEGMELQALEGARNTIAKFSPILLIEHIKSNQSELIAFLEKYEYTVSIVGQNLLAMSKDATSRFSA